MKVLVVCSYNAGSIAPFIVEQAEALIDRGFEIDYFTIQKKGITGYLLSRKKLLQKINSYTPDIIHAHYGLSGLLANLQHKVPVVTTYHGSDINNPKARFFSFIAIKLSKFNIFVSQKLIDIAKPKGKYTYLPCGIDLSLFQPKSKMEARKKLNLDVQKKYILFSGTFSNTVKNYPLAKQAVETLQAVELLELNRYARWQVALLMNAVDVVLMTSFTEGSPQFIKEAMACNCPIVSTDVGDVKEVIGSTTGCYITSFDATDVTDKLRQALVFNSRTSGRSEVLRFDNKLIVEKIIEVYNQVLKSRPPK
ncbi:MAG: glycosyltransferase [Paludibacteraceae bacterium]|nr:glycosyltransferase [Paludibacteraceae bacterium]